MIKLFIETSGDCPLIENTERTTTSDVISSDILDSLPDNCEYIFIVKNENIQQFDGLTTISDSPSATISIITDENISSFVNKKIQNAFLFVSNPDNFYRNFCSIVQNISGFIEFKFAENISGIDKPLDKIVDHMLFLIQNKIKIPIVKNLQGFEFADKFEQFGETSFFVNCFGDMYYHPAFSYVKKEKICAIKEFNINNEKFFHFTKPHLMCMNCETFYCDRNIYINKIKTNEFMVPSSSTCALTTIINKYSMKLFNAIYNQNIVPKDNLDKADSFDAENEYANLLSGKCLCNKIKGINYFDRKLYEKE